MARSHGERFRWRWVVLAVVPALALGLLIPFLWLVRETSSFHRRYVTFVAALALVVAFHSLIMVWALMRSARRNRTLSGDLDVLRRRNRMIESQMRGLQSQVELLTAMRQVSRLASDDVRFERIVTDILQIVGDLVGARELTLFVNEPNEDRLVPRARRVEKKTLFDDAIDTVAVEPEQANQALIHRSVLRTLEHERLDVLVPLVADQEPLGVLHLCVELDGDPQERVERSELIEQVLTDVATHVSLALKTTTLATRSVMDGATRLFNKTQLLKTLQHEMISAHRSEEPLSLVMLDIDHFKLVNDTFGHPTGDRVLVELAGLLKQNLRRNDSAYRYGGEEMAVLLPGATVEAAAGLAERLRKRVESRKFRTAGKESIDVTVSLGVAQLTQAMTDPQAFIQSADRALYAAKHAGRNCVRLAERA